MGNRVPHIWLVGDKDYAELFLRRAKVELFRTKQVVEKMGVPVYHRRVKISETVVIDTLVTNVGEYITIHAVQLGEAPLVPAIPVPDLKFIALYSGFAYKNWLLYDSTGQDTEAQFPTLEDFCPTQRTLKHYPDDFPLDQTYQENLRLNVRPSDTLFRWNFSDPTFPANSSFGPPLDDVPDPSNDLSGQTQRIRPCMFSGLLQKAASLAISHGDMRTNRVALSELVDQSTASTRYLDLLNTQGFQCEYEQRHERTHGIVKRGNTSWLVEISETNGIIARRLPILNRDLFKNLIKEEADEVKEVGGVPTGEAFPTDRAEVLAGINEGWILELQPPEYMETYYDDYTPYVAFDDFGYSWCFNPTGSEARTTTWGVLYPGQSLGNNAFTSAYWKITFETEPSSPFSATLSIIREDPMIQGAETDRTPALLGTGTTYPNSSQNITIPPVQWAQVQPSSAHVVSIGTTPTAGHANIWDDIPEDMDAVVWVGWIDGDWSEIHYRSKRVVENSRILEVPHVTSVQQAHDLVAEIGEDIIYYDFNDDPGHPIPGFDWYQLAPSPWSTELNLPEKDWVDYRPYRYTHLLDAEVHNEEQFMYRQGRYHYIYYSFWAVHLSHNLKLPSGATYFLTAPFNRNAYFCIDRTNKEGNTSGNYDRNGDTLVSGSNVSVKASNSGSPSGAPNPETQLLDLASLSPTYGGYGIFGARPHSFINWLDDDTIWDGTDSAACSSPPSPPYHVYDGTTTLTATGTGSPASQGGKFTTNYEVYDGGTWWTGTTVLCDPISPPPIATSVPSSREDQGSRAFGIDLPEDTAFEGSIKVWLVADRLPDGPVKLLLDIPDATQSEVIFTENGTHRPHMNWWCQVAVMGELAAIHTDLSVLPDQVYTTGLAHLKGWKYTTAGIHPPLPDFDTSYELTRLTFVGVNGP